MKIYRVLDDGILNLSTKDPLKALKAVMALLDKYEITDCEVDMEEVK